MVEVPFVDLGRAVAAERAALNAAFAGVLRSGRFVLSEQVEGFERELARACDAREAIGVASGTDAIELALRALGIGRGDEVVTQANTCVPTVAAIERAGATPVLCDVEPAAATMDPASLEGAIGPRCAAVVPVHLYGQIGDIEAIVAIADRGGALASVLRCARGEWLFYTDGDGQYDPEELVRAVALAGPDVDVVQGYKRGRADPWIRRLVGGAYSFVARVGFGLRIRDPDCDFRLIRGELARGIRLDSESGAAPVELVWRLQEAGARFVETEVGHFARHSGNSQFFTFRSVSRTIADIIRLWLELIARRRLRRAADWWRTAQP